MSVISNNVLAGAAGQSGGAGYIIERSLRLDTSSCFNATLPAGNRKTFTFSFWFKHPTNGGYMYNTGGNGFIISMTSNRINVYDYANSAYRFRKVSQQYFRDPTAWHHFVLSVDTTESVADDRVKIYINGERMTDFSTSVNPAQDTESFVGANANVTINSYNNSGFGQFYYAEWHFIDGQALAATDFGKFDDNNSWNPIAYTGSYGTAGYYLDFSDPTSTTTLGLDRSGNGNNHTPNSGISVASGSGGDSFIDSPTDYEADSGNNGGNYCILNKRDTDNHATVYDHGLKYTLSNEGGIKGTIGVTSGKWYWEAKKLSGSSQYHGFGIAETGTSPSTYPGGYFNSASWLSVANNVYASGNFARGNGATAMPALGNSDIIGVALDLDSATKTCKFYRNGSEVTENWIDITSTKMLLPAFGSNSADTSGIEVNFGQRPFEYTPPAGHLPLCTQNLPDPAFSDGTKGFDVATWTGTSSSALSIPTTTEKFAFSPDLVWIKSRGTGDHVIYDTVRGAGETLRPNHSYAEATDTNTLTAFNTDGFTVGPNATTGQNTVNYVGWSWDAGTTTVTNNTDGSVTPTGLRANPQTGVSIITYTGTGNADTVGHGLNSPPRIVFHKNRDTAQTNWRIFTDTVDGTMDTLFLNSQSLKADSSLTAPTSSVINLGTHADHNGLDENYVAYCFAEVDGFSAFGSYIGQSGYGRYPFITTGFLPKFVMIKVATGASGNNWHIFDKVRSEPGNTTDDLIYANQSLAEAADSTAFTTEFYANGFRITSAETGLNTAGTYYIYMAFAEHPFKTGRAH